MKYRRSRSRSTSRTGNCNRDKKRHRSHSKSSTESNKNSRLCFGLKQLLNINSKNIEQWAIDSGAAVSVTNNLDNLINVKPSSETLYAANGQPITVTNIGTFVRKLQSGLELEIHNVRYTKDVNCSLLSLTSTPHNYSTVFKGDKAYLINNDDINWKKSIKFCEKDENNLFKILFEKKLVNQISNDKTLQIHKKFGHPNPLVTRKIAEKFKLKFNEYNCLPCIKYFRDKIPKFSRRTTYRPIELLHFDTKKLKQETIDGTKYILFVVDDYSRTCFIEKLRSKESHSVCENLVKLFKILERQLNLKIKKLRSDNGGEFENGILRNFIKENGIIYEKSLPGEAHQNSVVERFIQTVFRKANILMEHLPNISETLFAEAVKTATYLHNITPLKKLNFKTPADKLKHFNQMSDKLYLFGEKVYCFKHDSFKKHERKLVIFVGYEILHKAYTVYDPEKNKCFPTKFVVPIELLSRKDKTNLNEVSLFEQTRSLNDQLNFESQLNFIAKNQLQNLNNITMNLINNINYIRRNFNLFKNDLFIVTAKLNCKVKDVYVPKSFDDIKNSNFKNEFYEATKEEYNQMIAYNVWAPINVPINTKLLKTKWIFVFKELLDGLIRFKARLVAVGYSQRPGIDYTEVFSPTLSLENLRIFLVIAKTRNHIVWQADVTNAYLNSEIDHEISIDQPDGFRLHQPIQKGFKIALKLLKSLYGTKQSGRCWYFKLVSILTKLNFRMSLIESTIFYNEVDDILIGIYVDDLIISALNETIIKKLIDELNKNFKLRDVFKLNKMLSINFIMNENETFLHQESKIEEIIKTYKIKIPNKIVYKFRPEEFNTFKSSPLFDDKFKYQSLIGFLLYISRTVRPDITFIVNYLSGFCNEPKHEHYSIAIKLLNYLASTKNLRLKFELEKPEDIDYKIVAYSDSDFANNVQDRKSYSGKVIFLNGCPIIWNTQKQRIVAQSVDEAEIIAANEVSRSMIYVKNLIQELFKNVKLDLNLKIDNTGCIRFNKEGNSKRTKHIDLKFHFLRNLVNEKIVKIEYVSSENNLADLFTKILKPYLRTRHIKNLKLV